MKCEECHLLIQRKIKTKHINAKKHKSYPNLVLNTYIVKDVKLDKLQDVDYKYYFDHMKNLIASL